MSRTSVLKAPVWTWEVPWYAFVGGLAGASAQLAVAARLGHHAEVARAARRMAAAATLASPPLLISDLGRPERFHHMLRVAKPTSPMSVGSWTLAAFGPAAVGSAVLAEWGRWPRLQRQAESVAGGLGPVMATYTGVLFANTAIPAWREAGRELPALFAGSATASAGAAAVVLTSPASAGAARRVAVGGAALELGAGALMHRRLGEAGAAYEGTDAGLWERRARLLTAAGAALTLRGGRASRSGAGLVLAGSACLRWAVYRAGFASARLAR